MKDGLAIRIDGYVYVAGVTVDASARAYQMLLAKYPSPSAPIGFGGCALPAPSRGISDNYHVLRYEVNPNNLTDPARLAAKVLTEGAARQLIDEYEKKQSDATMGAVKNFALHLIPGYSAYESFSHGDYIEGTIALAADILMVSSFGLGTLAKAGVVGARAAQAARALRLANIGYNSAVFGYRIYQGGIALYNGQGVKAAGYLGDATLRLLGMTPDLIAEIKALRTARAVTAVAPTTTMRFLPAGVVRNNLSGQALRDVEATTGQLLSLRNTAQTNIANGTTTSTSPWIARLRALTRTDPSYPRIYGNALQEEFFALARAEQVAGGLPRNMVFNSGVSHPSLGLTNSYNGLRPDVRLSLGSGREAVWDLTTIGQAGASNGHSAPYARSFVDWAVDLPYIRP